MLNRDDAVTEEVWVKISVIPSAEPSTSAIGDTEAFSVAVILDVSTGAAVDFSVLNKEEANVVDALSVIMPVLDCVELKWCVVSSMSALIVVLGDAVGFSEVNVEVVGIKVSSAETSDVGSSGVFGERVSSAISVTVAAGKSLGGSDVCSVPSVLDVSGDNVGSMVLEARDPVADGIPVVTGLVGWRPVLSSTADVGREVTPAASETELAVGSCDAGGVFV